MDKNKTLIFVTLILAGLALFFIFSLPINDKDTNEVSVGSTIPGEDFTDIYGNTIDLSSYSNEPILLSFLYFLRDDSVESQKTRSQLNFIRSMCTQYHEEGLKVIFVDATPYITGKRTEGGILQNYVFDSELGESATWVEDYAKKIGRLYSVFELPTTFLIADGTILQRWDSIATSNQLAFPIMDYLSNGYVSEGIETPPEAKFPGLPSARSLSDQIWLIDGGIKWTAGDQYGVRWAIINEGTSCSLQVTAVHLDTGETINLFEGGIHNIPSDEADVLLSNMAEYKDYELGLVDLDMILNYKGSYRLVAEVTDSETKELYSKGEALITVK